MKLRTALLAGAGAVLIAALAAQAQVPGVNSTLNAVFTLVYDQSTMKPTYSSTMTATTATTPGDVCLLKGSATKTIKVRRVIVSGKAATVVTEPVLLIKRSTMTTTGTGTLPVITAYDSTNSLSGSTTNTATAVTEVFTANPTAGTFVGELISAALQYANTSTGLGSTYTMLFGQLGSPVVLRGIAQNIAVNLGGITVASGELTCTFEWTEE